MLLPLTAILFLNPIERMLREGHEQAVAESALAAAALIETRGRMAVYEPAQGAVLYLHSVPGNRLLDGYADDWQGGLDRVIGIDRGTVFDRTADALDSGLDPVRIAAVNGSGYLALYLRVQDRSPAYAGADGRPGDAVVIALGTGRPLVFEPASPGPVVLRDGAGRLVRGYWQDRVDGWSLEVRLPRQESERSLDVTVLDRGRDGRILAQHRADRLRLVARDDALDALLEQLSVGPAWIVDESGWVLAHDASELVRAERGDRVPGVFDFLMAARLEQGSLRSAETGRLNGPEVTAALNDEAGTVWQRVGESRSIRLRHARRLEVDGAELVLVIERDAGPLLLLANRAVLTWLGASLAVFMAVALVLFGFVLILTLRIRRLRNAAERAVEQGGRVGELPAPSTARDEIGDLSRSLRGLLERLREHQSYLQTLADKLAHELRTPVSMVQSSLENLAAESDPGRAGNYLRRAGQGADRLRRIVRAMSQAARLEDSLTGETRRPMRLQSLVADYVAARQDAVEAGGRSLVFVEPTEAAAAAEIEGSEDLLAQLLDKIIDNAVDFTPEGGRIELSLSETRSGLRLSIENDGASIDPERRAAMFESMVSWRPSGGEAPHLGLGLYVARCIVDYHGGRIDARPTATGTAVDVDLPIRGVVG